MAKASDTRCEGSAHVGIDECHLSSLVEILIVHVMDEVQRLHINTCQPFHHIFKARHELFVGNHVARDGAISWTALLAALSVYTAVDSIEKTLGQVGTCTEELHFLTSLSGTDAAADTVVVAPNRTHHVVVLILDRTGYHRNLSSIMLETLRQA